MKLAIISDIHGNLEALQAVLDFLKKEGIDEIVCLGDIVGYGANPNECIDLIKKVTDKVIAGNHDWGAVGLTDTSFFNQIAKTAIDWTKENLTPASKDFIISLPLTLTKNDLYFVHGTPSSPEQWNYLFRGADAVREFKAFHQQICFIGHTHNPQMFAMNQKGMVFQLNYSEQRIERDRRYIINVGSVGQPRDLVPEAAVGIYDLSKKFFTLVRITYNVKEAQQKIMDVGLPVLLAERLEIGW